MILVIAELTIPLLAIPALDKLIKAVDKNEDTLPFVNKQLDLKKY